MTEDLGDPGAFLRVVDVAPPWYAVPPPAYGGVEAPTEQPR